MNAILITPFGVCHNNFILSVELIGCWLQFWDNQDSELKRQMKNSNQIKTFENELVFI